MIIQKQETIAVDEINTSQKSIRNYIKPVQSANVLFKFMKDIKYLKEALSYEAILPRYCDEDIKYLNIKDTTKIAFPMVCFCDIHFNKLSHHIDKYGVYGIGLNKQWGIEQGIQPIHYINPESQLSKDYSNAFNIAIENIAGNSIPLNVLKSYTLHHLLYMKPIDGEMRINKNETQKRNFHDEKEWRFVPNFNNVDTQLPQIVFPPSINHNSLDNYSNGLKTKPELWLHFKYENIKYIIVKSNSERTELIKFIMNDLNVPKDIEYILFSKILVFEELGEDI